jgi:tetratricopeptide (TPR) repeat protein
LVAAVLVLAAVAAGQPRLEFTPPSPATVRLGDTAQATVRVHGASSIEPRLPLVPGVILRSSGSESVRSIVNGRVSAYTQVALLLTPQRAGRFTIPAIPVQAGGQILQTPEFAIEAVEDLRGKDMGFVDVQTSAPRVYVNEPLRVRVACGIDKGLQIAVRGQTRTGQNVFDVEVRAPWLAALEGATALESPALGESWLILRDGEVQETEYDEHERDGRTFHRFRFEKSFLPTTPGVLELSAATVAVQVVTGRPQVGLFGERIQGRTESIFLYGEPRRVEVLALPKEGRPADYSGGVGRFALSARLDKERVKVGNSVKLHLTIEGIGNTERFAVPELAPGGLHVLGKTEQRTRDRVEVTYDLTPLTAEVREVPPVAWSYFDTTPGKERYETLRTPALPLTVQPLAESETLAALPGQPSTAVTPGVDDIFDIKPLERTPPAPLRAPPSPGLGALALLAPWIVGAALAFAFARARRRAADVVGQRARGAAGELRRALRAGEEPHAALVAYLAARLGVEDAAIIGPDLAQRLAAAGVPDGLVPALCGAVEAGVAARYGGRGEVSADDVRALVERLERTPLRPLASLGLALLLLASAMTAQDPAAGEAAYRRGDYAQAGAQFAAAAARDADARVLYNLGNSLFRQGQLGAAIVAWERARLALPRDAELAANLALARARLELGRGEGEPFLDAVRELRDRFTPRERLGGAIALHACAALLLLLGGRRRALRALGWFALVPALLLTLEVLWWGPARPPLGIVVAERAAVVAEPRAGLEALMTLQEGVEVDVLGEGPQWTQVRVRGRSGYVPSAAVGVVRR